MGSWYSSRLASDFTDASKFQKTQLYTTDAGSTAQCAKGRSLAREYTVHISVDDTWCATRRGETVSSYEKIGYHADSAALLQGFIDSGCTFFVHRWSDTLGSAERYAIAGTECTKL